MSTTEELACVYSSLILQDGGVPIAADKIQALLKAANVDVEPYWPGIFAKAVESLDVKGLVTNVVAGPGTGPAAPSGDAAPAAAAEEKKEEKKEEEEEEDDDMGFGLFD